MLKRIIKLIETEFGSEKAVPQVSHESRADAKNRLKLVLKSDRCRLGPGVMNRMREDILTAINKYVEIDRESFEFNYKKETDSIALVANIPVLSNNNGDAMASS